jgi:hypothetical protein
MSVSERFSVAYGLTWGYQSGGGTTAPLHDWPVVALLGGPGEREPWADFENFETSRMENKALNWINVTMMKFR